MRLESNNIIGERILSPQDVRDVYLYGIDTTAKDGRPLSDDVIEMYIDSAQEELEGYLSIKMIPQTFVETLNYRYDDILEWGFMQVCYPVAAPKSLVGKISGLQSTEYPIEWLSARQASDETYFRVINIVPNTPLVGATIIQGVMPMKAFGYNGVPNYWTVTYNTGYKKPPSDLVNFIGKMTAMNIFNNLGDLILGAGIASQSIGIDGLSQSISTTSSAENSGYSSRVKAYKDDLKESLPRVETKYKGIQFGVM